MAGNSYLLEMNHITKSYVGVHALKDVTIKIRPGSVHALVGENGAGKSTLMKILAGEVQPNSGEILFEGKKVSFANRKAAIECGVSIIHQEMVNVLDMTVAENLFMGREFRKQNGIFIDLKKMNAEARKLLSTVNLDISPSKKMRTLTVAQMQMCEIAKAVSYNSKVFIMDEPTSAITESETEILFELIRRLKNDGHAIIYISHKLEEIYEIADEISVLRDGVKVAEFDYSDVPRKVLVKNMVDRDILDIYPKREKKTNGVGLQVEGLEQGSKFKDISFEVHYGEIFGIAGLMGAGRTEIVEAIFGMTKLDHGDIYINGKKVVIKNPRTAIKNGIGLITDDRKLKGLIMPMNIKDNIVITNYKAFTSSALNLINWPKIKRESNKFVDILKIKTPNLEQRVEALSGGNQQKVVLSKWLIKDPDILIFDEPTRGIDIAAKTDFYNHIAKLAEDGKAIIFISSEMQEVVGMCDRVLVLHEGKAMGELIGKDITQEKIMHLATGE
jgi:inositol transport system ATP-binding protein